MPRAPLITWFATRKQMRAARCGPGCDSGSHRAAAGALLAATAPRPHAPDLGRRRPLGRSRGHMAEGDAGSDQRQVRARRGADLQAGLGLASPPRASSAEGPSARDHPRSRRHRPGSQALRLLHCVPFYLRLFADRPPAGFSRAFGKLGLPRTVSSSTINHQHATGQHGAGDRSPGSAFCPVAARSPWTSYLSPVSAFAKWAIITQTLEFLEGPLDLTPLDTELSPVRGSRGCSLKLFYWAVRTK